LGTVMSVMSSSRKPFPTNAPEPKPTPAPDLVAVAAASAVGDPCCVVGSAAGGRKAVAACARRAATVQQSSRALLGWGCCCCCDRGRRRPLVVVVVDMGMDAWGRGGVVVGSVSTQCVGVAFCVLGGRREGGGWTSANKRVQARADDSAELLAREAANPNHYALTIRLLVGSFLD
jgi:hypothetical protein